MMKIKVLTQPNPKPNPRQGSMKRHSLERAGRKKQHGQHRARHRPQAAGGRAARRGHSQHRVEALEEHAEGLVDAVSLLLPRAARLHLGAAGALAAGEIDDPQETLPPSTLERGLVRERSEKARTRREFDER